MSEKVGVLYRTGKAALVREVRVSPKQLQTLQTWQYNVNRYCFKESNLLTWDEPSRQCGLFSASELLATFLENLVQREQTNAKLELLACSSKATLRLQFLASTFEKDKEPSLFSHAIFHQNALELPQVLSFNCGLIKNESNDIHFSWGHIQLIVYVVAKATITEAHEVRWLPGEEALETSKKIVFSHNTLHCDQNWITFFFFICNQTPTKISRHDTWISMRSVPFLWIDLQPLLKLRTCDYLALILKSLKLICTTAAKGCYLFIVLIFRGYQQVKQCKNKKMLTT